jgi:glycosyltransferase involved in cell wall biosynthesis
MTRSGPLFVSLVVPVYNEETSIGPFLQTLEPLLAELGCKSEIIFVNDGSRDRTLDVLRAAKEINSSIMILSLSRNFGKEAALTAGLDHAKGDAVIPIDVDLQDPPELIGAFITRWRAGADIVYGARSSRASDSFLKRVSATCFYKVFNSLSPVKVPLNAGDYRLMDRRVVDEIKTLRERNRFMKGLMVWPGFRLESVEFERQERASGRTSWNYWKLWNFALDGITSFSTAPLRLWLYVGGVISLLSFLYAAFIIIHVIFAGADVPGYASLIVAVMFFGGIQLFTLGLMGEYIGRILNETKARPIYIIETIE